MQDIALAEGKQKEVTKQWNPGIFDIIYKCQRQDFFSMLCSSDLFVPLSEKSYLISLLQIASGVSNSPRNISENFSGS